MQEQENDNSNNRRKIVINVERNILPDEMARLMDGLKAMTGFDFYIQAAVYISDYKPKPKPIVAESKGKRKRKNKRQNDGLTIAPT